MKMLGLPAALLFSIHCLAQPSIRLKEHPVTLTNGTNFNLKIPEGFSIFVAADGFKRPRFFAKSPDNRLFITDMYNVSDNSEGKVWILEGWDSTTHRFGNKTVYLEGLRNPNQVAFYQKNGENYIYVAETDKLSYYVYKNGDTKPSSKPVIIARFPDYGLSYKYGGWHLTRSLAFHNNKLYVSVGSSCDACIEKEYIRATIIEMDPDGRNQRYYARGLRNSVGMKWVHDKLWVTSMGRDNLGPDRPEDLFHSVTNNGYYGWPFYYQYRRAIIPDRHFLDSTKPVYAKDPQLAQWGFKAHSAPLGFTYISSFRDSALNNSFIVALHGSTTVTRQRGNAVVQIMSNGTYRDIVSGFLQGRRESSRYGRPCDVLQWDDRSIFISDDKNGVIYYLYKN